MSSSARVAACSSRTCVLSSDCRCGCGGWISTAPSRGSITSCGTCVARTHPIMQTHATIQPHTAHLYLVGQCKPVLHGEVDRRRKLQLDTGNRGLARPRHRAPLNLELGGAAGPVAPCAGRRVQHEGHVRPRAPRAPRLRPDLLARDLELPVFAKAGKVPRSVDLVLQGVQPKPQGGAHRRRHHVERAHPCQAAGAVSARRTTRHAQHARGTPSAPRPSLSVERPQSPSIPPGGRLIVCAKSPPLAHVTVIAASRLNTIRCAE